MNNIIIRFSLTFILFYATLYIHPSFALTQQYCIQQGQTQVCNTYNIDGSLEQVQKHTGGAYGNNQEIDTTTHSPYELSAE